MRGDQAGERQSKVVLISVAMIGRSAAIRSRVRLICVIPARRSRPRLDFGGPP
jgi:hypothetical protein